MCDFLQIYTYVYSISFVFPFVLFKLTRFLSICFTFVKFRPIFVYFRPILVKNRPKIDILGDRDSEPILVPIFLHFGTILGEIWPPLGAILGVLGPLGPPPGCLLGLLGASWASYGPPNPNFDRFWTNFDRFLTKFNRF